MWRLRVLCTSHLSPLSCRGLRTRPPLHPFSEDQHELESDAETEGNMEQEIRSALKRQKKAILLKRMKKEMEPPEPAERRLTWNAIHQIRYLRQEFPEEWPLSRLAVGFNVSTDAIKKVLKSNFIPSDTRRMKQDASVSRVLGQTPGSTNVQVQLGATITNPAQPLIPVQGSKRPLLISQPNQLLPPPKTADFSALALRTGHLTASLARTQAPRGSMQGVTHAASSQGLTTSTQAELDQTINEEEDESITEEEWDGEVLSVEELEELANSGVPNNMKVVQKGQEFFDSDGNFLYRL